MRLFWQKTQQILHKIGDFQARLLLTLLYAVLILPVGVALRLSEDTLNACPKKNAGTYWQPRKELDSALRHARRQS
jgi:hypothetical protein